MADQLDALTPAGVSELASFIIRPPRAQYQPSELGDRIFLTERVQARRDDVVLRNAKGLQLYGSHFRPVDSPANTPAVVYLHGNGSCRVEATMLTQYVVPYGLSLFAFDFSGSGMSDGEYISLGVNEKHDVEAVVDYLVASCGIRGIVFWGHSMGAATAVMYAGLCKRRPEVKGLFLDSPFASFEKLAHSMVADMPLPMAVPRKLILSVGVRAVRKVVRDRADFDVSDIDPLSASKKITYDLPALFVHGSADAVVPLQHGQLLYKSYPSERKEMVVIPGYEHDSARPEWVMDRAHIFFQKHLRVDGVRDLQFLDHLKGRGNSAMFSKRYRDSIYLYTEALNALSESITNQNFAVAVGETSVLGNTDDTDTDEAEGRLARRNSSISNFVSTVKRWRHARPLFAAEDGLYQKPSLSSTNNPQPASATIISTTEPKKVGKKAPRRHSTQLQMEKSKVISEEKRTSVDKGIDNAEEGLTNECSRSDSSARSSRFSRNSNRHWRARSLVESIKNKIRFSKVRVHSTAAANEDLGDDNGLRSTGFSPHASQDIAPLSTMSAPSSTRSGRGLEEGKGRRGEGESQKGLSWRSAGTGRVSRSPSSRVQLRHRGRRRQTSRRRSRAGEGLDGEQSKEVLYGNEDVKRRKAPDLSSIRQRFSASDTLPRHGGDILMREHSEQNNTGYRNGISSWNLTEEQEAVALALLGNRSLARRKMKNMEGALFDANICLELDPGWMRGYVRKAAALRDTGLLEDARDCLLEGLRKDGEHAGLADMLKSIELALEAQALAKDRIAGDGIDARGYVRKAAALRDTGLLEDARDCLLEGLRKDGEHAGLADMLQSIELALEAQALAKDRIAGDGIDARGYVRKAAALRDTGLLEDARDCLLEG